jgi:hypothetical protein
MTSSFKKLNMELRHSVQGNTGGMTLTEEVPLSRIQVEPRQSSENDIRCLASVPVETDMRLVLIEWKYYEEPAGQPGSSNRAIARIQRLVRLLVQRPKPEDFRVLDCVGYAHDRHRARIGLILALPSLNLRDSGNMELQRSWSSFSKRDKVEEKRDVVWINLHDLIKLRPKLPLLGHRYALSLALVKCMIQLHATGWFHKGFRSANVLFFRAATRYKDDEGIADEFADYNDSQQGFTPAFADITRPHIAGFEYSRPSNNLEVSDQIGKSGSYDELYIHPTYLAASSAGANSGRVSSNSGRFSAEYDMHSLGCVLLEIGLWRRLADMWKPEYKESGWPAWAQRLQQKWVPELGGRCGEVYQQAVHDLLSRTKVCESVEGDDAKTPMTNFELVHCLESLKV